MPRERVPIGTAVAVAAVLALTGCFGDLGGVGPGDQAPSVASVAVTPDAATLPSVGETLQLTATARDASEKVISGKTFTWSSSNESVASVGSLGLVMANADGTATITAETDGVSGSAALTVLQVPDAFYVCDCARGADGDCVSGNDTASGRSAATAWRSYDRAQKHWANLLAGEQIRFCAGGAFEIPGEYRRWANTNCSASVPCVVSDYEAPWASGDEGRPIIWLDGGGHAFALEDGGDPGHEEGYVFENLELRCTVCESTSGWGFYFYNDIDDVVIDNVVIDGFAIGVHLAGANPCGADPSCDRRNERITLRNSTIVNSHSQGWLGSGNFTVIENNYFENNGSTPVFDHNVYYSGSGEATTGSRIVGNELYRSALDAAGSCAGVSLVVHGIHDALLIEGNVVREDVGFAGQGCWGIAVDPGYFEAESFTDLVIRGNAVYNVGNIAIGVASCTDCLIENNVIVHEQPFALTAAIAAPDRTRGSEDATMTNVDVRNNSIYVGDGGGRAILVGSEGSGHSVVSNAILYFGTSSDWSCLDTDLSAGDYEDIDHNVCAFPNAGVDAEWEKGSGTLPDALTAWQNAMGFGGASVLTAPGFTAPAAPSFDLSALSGTAAIVDAGHPTLSAPTDFYGNVRDGLPDAGAFEYGVTGQGPNGAPSVSAMRILLQSTFTTPRR